MVTPTFASISAVLADFFPTVIYSYAVRDCTTSIGYRSEIAEYANIRTQKQLAVLLGTKV